MITSNIESEGTSSYELRARIRTVPGGLPAGESSVLFSGGHAVRDSNTSLVTIAIVVVELDSEIRESIYQYIHAIQMITQRARPVIITDTDDLRGIRRYGWLTEHLISRPSLHKLEPSMEWVGLVVQRVVATAERLDVARTLVVTEEGVTRQIHLDLMNALDSSVPFGAVAFRPRTA